MHYNRILLGLLILTSTPFAEVTLFNGTPGGVGNISVHDETGTNAAVFPVELQGIQLLMLDFVGRTELEELLTDKPRLYMDVPGASRVRMPGSGGSLYHYRRDLSPSGAVFGWMWIGSDGTASSLWELQGTGPTNDVNPVIPRVGVDPSGGSFLFATTVAAGGDLFDLDIATSTATLRTALIGPESFSVAGLFLRSSWGIGAGTGGVWRFDRTAGAQVEAVPITPSASWFSGEVAVSGDGLVATTAAGSSPDMAHIYTFAATGSALQVTPTPTTIFAAGYLPEYRDGPFLALNQDGSCCAFATNVGAREAFLAEGVSPINTTTLQLTDDATYLDTLDEIGVLFFVPGALVLAVGEMDLAPGQGVENLDFYRALTNGAPVPQLQNLSLSSGVPLPPFFVKSTVQPDSIRLLPAGDKLLVLNSDAGIGKLILVDTAGAAPVLLLDEAKSVDLVEHSAGRLLLAVRRENLAETRDLFVLDLLNPTALTTLGSLPDTFEFDRPAVRADGRIAFNVRDTLGAGDFLARVNLPALKGKLLVDFPLSYGPTMTWTETGSLMFSVEQPAADTLVFGWPLAPFIVHVADAPTTGFILPN